MDGYDGGNADVWTMVRVSLKRVFDLQGLELTAGFYGGLVNTPFGGIGESPLCHKTQWIMF